MVSEVVGKNKYYLITIKSLIFSRFLTIMIIESYFYPMSDHKEVEAMIKTSPIFASLSLAKAIQALKMASRPKIDQGSPAPKNET